MGEGAVFPLFMQQWWDVKVQAPLLKKNEKKQIRVLFLLNTNMYRDNALIFSA